MKKLGLLVMPLMAIPLLASCNNGGGDKPEEVKFSLSSDWPIEVLDNKTAKVYVDWTPTDIIKFESFTFSATPSKENTVTFDQTGNPRPMPVTITFKEDITTDISGTLSFAYEDVTAKTKGESSLSVTIPEPGPSPTKSENTFVFKSDYCTLNNEDSYQNNTKVDLTLNISDEYIDAYVVPDDIEVLLGSKTGELGKDYQYTISEDSKSATLSLTMSDNVVVHAMYNDSDNIHRVTEKQFNEAIAMENIPYIQHEYEFYRYYYSGATKINLNRIDYISPHVNYQFVSNIVDTGSIKQIESEPKFYSKDKDGRKWDYSYDKEKKAWSKDDSEQEKINFLVSADVSPKSDTTIASYLKYDKIKSRYNQETSLYSYEVIEEKTSNKYVFTLSFDKNRLMSLSYETNAEQGYLCYVSYSYFKIVPNLPEVLE